jgi:UTP--glucose-1-phosphate uridylyltransferase
VKIRKAVITAAGPAQRALPLQTLIDRDGVEKPLLRILIEEALRARIEQICVVVYPGDGSAYAASAGDHAGRVKFIDQTSPRGYGHAVWCARPFTAGEPFLHLVGDHLYIPAGEKGCAQALVEIAEAEDCAVSAVQPTREHLLPNYGAVGGQVFAGRKDLYRIDTVIEKPTPTEAEQRLIVPGMRAGHYLCFFGMHVLTPAVMEILDALLAESGSRNITLSRALAELARREKYLAYEIGDRRYDVGARYGLLTAQLALALSGKDRAEVLAQILDVVAARHAPANVH